MAVLFAVVTTAIVVAYGAAGGNLSSLGDGETAFALELAGNEAASSTTVPDTSAPAPSSTVTIPPSSTTTAVAGPEIDPSAAVHGLSEALSYAEMETTTTTEAETTTTEPETTTTEAPSTESSETTAADTSSTETTSSGTNEDGWVDAGHGVYLPPVMLSIRYCESKDNYTAENPSSTASGAYQFLTSSWADYGHASRYGVSTAGQATPAQQDEAALITWQSAGTSPWNASKHCWG